MRETSVSARARQLMKGAVDLHVHTSPDVVPRSASAIEVARAALAYDMGAIALKSHVTDTSSRAETARESTGFPLFGGVALNHSVGGFNPHAVRESAQQGGRIVWLPTASSRHFLKHVLDPNDRRTPGRLQRSLSAVDDSGDLLESVERTLVAIQRADLVLCSGHLGPEESLTVFRRAAELGIDRLVMTHPHADFIGTTVNQMRLAADLGAKNEILFAFTTSAVKVPQTVEYLARLIREVGVEHCYVATDGGQAANPISVEMYRAFVEGLIEQGFSDHEIIQLTQVTPARLLLEGAPSTVGTPTSDSPQKGTEG